MPEDSRRDDIAAVGVRLRACRDSTATSTTPETGDSDRYGDHESAPDDPTQTGSHLAEGEQVTIRTTPFAEMLSGATGQAEIGNARNRFERWLTDVGIDDETVEELAIVFSELAANAVTASAPGTLARLRAYRDETNVVLEAVNGSPQTVPRDRGAWDLADPLRPGGRGLLIVNEYMDNVQVEPADDLNGILVRCRRSLVV